METKRGGIHVGELREANREKTQKTQKISVIKREERENKRQIH